MNRAKRAVMSAMIVAGVFFADQGIKLAIRQMPYGETLFRLEGVIEMTHCVNTGAAFSLFEGRTLLIALLSGVLLAALVVFLARGPVFPVRTQAALSVLVGGGVGNLFDRVVFGGVTDYIRVLFIRFPVFNLADICVTCAIAFLLLQVLTGKLDLVSEKNQHGSDH